MNHGFKLHNDGTLEIIVPNGVKVGRVFVLETGTQNGSLYYPDVDNTNTNVGDMISRQAALDGKISIQRANGLEIYSDEAVPVEYLKRLPSAESERKTAEWIYGDERGQNGWYQDGWYCSECGFFIPWDYEYYGSENFDFIADFHTCPKCDAKILRYTGMRGEQDEIDKR